jgi:DNA topoisomerase-1
MDPVQMPELACETVEDHYVLRDGASGMFLAASKFPKNRETRAPLVEELLPHKDAIDPKYEFIFSAPTEDDEGNKTLVRFSRKTKEQYIQTEVDKKATGWKAFYRDGKWDVEKPKKKAAAKGKKKTKKKAGKKVSKKE